ncbi:MAG: mechanosensitive ion channel family protein [Planctomycetota bacterium]|nr:MAG: mechanosensitive ion channel family protein [Planctomycetota bacterium]
MPTLSHPLRHVARLALATLALLTLLLAPPTAAQELAADIELPELTAAAEAMDDATLATEIAGWMTRVETLRDAAQAAADDAPDTPAEAPAMPGGSADAEPAAEPAPDPVALAEAELDHAVQRLTALVAVMDARGGDAADAHALLTEFGEITVSTLELSTLQALAQRWIDEGHLWVEEDLPGVLARIVAALFVLLAFRLLASIVKRILDKTLSSSRLNVSTMLRRFFVNISGKVVMVFGLLFALGALGVELGPLLAGLGVAGFVLGFALQDTLANFASGIMILLYRPFEMGHIITAGDVTGTAEKLTLVSTTLLTPDHQRIIIPNNLVWSGIIINMTSQPARRADTTVGISYGDDIDKAIRAMREVCEAHPLVLKSPEMDVIVSNLGDSSVDITVRPWVIPDNYLPATADLRKLLKQKLDSVGITIPFPQRDVHVYKHDAPEEADEAAQS